RFVVLVRLKRPRGIRRVERRSLRFVPEGIGPLISIPPDAFGSEEPHFVALDRASDGPPPIVDVDHLARQRDASRAQVLAEVVGGQGLGGEETGRREAEGVGTLFW